MTPLEQTIRRKIAVDGPIRFDAYMQACLSLPETGYYQHQQAIGGKGYLKQGDFITAPEISQIFGEMIGIWLLDRWFALGEPSKFGVLELGPGKGTLMADALRLIARIEPRFIQSMHLGLYEQNQKLKDQQAEVLKPYAPIWLDDLGSSDVISRDHPLLVVANEFFDALPIRLFKHEQQKWSEIAINSVDGELEFAAEVLPPEMESLMPSLGTGNSKLETHWFELCPAAHQIMADLSKFIGLAGGAVMAIDYGYDQPNTAELTIQAIQDHQMVDVFHAPGETDLSAHVDFGALAKTAKANELKTWPLMTQAEMLQNLGSAQRLEQLLSIAHEDQATVLNSGYDRLTSSKLMGELFKVLVVSDASQAAWAGS